MSVDLIGEKNKVILELKIYTRLSTLKNYDQESFHFYTFQFVQNFWQHVSAYICILLRSSLFRIILIPDDIFRFYKNFRLPVLLWNFGFFFVVFFPIFSIGILPSKTERTFPFLGIFLYIWKIIASNKIDLAVYSSDVFLLSSEYLARIYPLIGNIAFRELYYCAVLT